MAPQANKRSGRPAAPGAVALSRTAACRALRKARCGRPGEPMAALRTRTADKRWRARTRARLRAARNRQTIGSCRTHRRGEGWPEHDARQLASSKPWFPAGAGVAATRCHCCRALEQPKTKKTSQPPQAGDCHFCGFSHFRRYRRPALRGAPAALAVPAQPAGPCCRVRRPSALHRRGAASPGDRATAPQPHRSGAGRESRAVQAQDIFAAPWVATGCSARRSSRGSKKGRRLGFRPALNAPSAHWTAGGSFSSFRPTAVLGANPFQ
jgi:hypothetical protein